MIGETDLEKRVFTAWAEQVAQACQTAASIGMPLDSETLMGLNNGALIKVFCSEIQKLQDRIDTLEAQERSRENYEREQSERITD